MELLVLLLSLAMPLILSLLALFPYFRGMPRRFYFLPLALVPFVCFLLGESFSSSHPLNISVDNGHTVADVITILGVIPCLWSAARSIRVEPEPLRARDYNFLIFLTLACLWQITVLYFFTHDCFMGACV